MDWLDRLWRIGFTTGVMLMGLAFGYILFAPDEEVSASGGVGVVMCVKIATTGPLDAYYCEPNLGQPFYINSVGFMVLED